MPSVSSLWSPMSRPDHLITVRRFRYTSAITIWLGDRGWIEGWLGYRCRRVDGSRGSDGYPHRQVQHSPKEDRTDAAEAIEECLGNSFAKKGDADRQARDQDARGAERCAQLDEALP